MQRSTLNHPTSSATITVVVATYNGQLYLEQQLVSICEQSHRPSHIIVSDDGSQDDTIAIAKSVLARYGIDHIVQVNPHPTHYSDNFFHAVALADSEYIAFCDQDDIWEPKKIEICIQKMEATGAQMCAHGASLIDADGSTIGSFNHGPKKSKIVNIDNIRPWFTFAGFTIIFKSPLLDLVDPKDRGRDIYRYHERLSHDSWATFLASSTGDIVFIADPLARYRQHGRNVVGARQETLTRRLILQLGPAAHPALNRSAIARRWATKLRKLAQRNPDAKLSANATAAAERWMRISAAELSRQRMYRHASVLRRAAVLAINVGKGHYLRRHKGLGVHYLPKDILIGVLRLSKPIA